MTLSPQGKPTNFTLSPDTVVVAVVPALKSLSVVWMLEPGPTEPILMFPTTSKASVGPEMPMPNLPVVVSRIFSEPAVPKIIAPVELAVKVSADCKVKAPDVVFQVEAAAAVRFKLLVAVMLLVLITIVFPIVAVAA